MRSSPDLEDVSRKRLFDAAVFRYFLPYLSPHAGQLVYCFLMMLVLSGASTIGPILIKLGLDVDIAGKDISGLVLRTLQYAILMLATFVLTWFVTVNVETVGQSILRRMRMQLFRKLLYMPMRYFTEHPVGKLIARVESDTEAVRVFFTSTSITLAQNLLMLGLIIAVMFSVSPELTWRMLIVLPVLAVTTVLFVRKVMPRFVEVRKCVANICAFVTESLSGMKVVQSFNQQERMAKGMDAENRTKFRVQYPAELFVIFYYNSIHLTYFLGVAIILWVGFKTALENPLTVGAMVMFIMYLERFYGPIRMISEQINVMQRAFAAGERIIEILKADTEIKDPVKPVNWPKLETEIRFEGVWFAYKGEEWVLRDVSFAIPKGQSWAIVGATGSGKSTILNLILRFYEPQKGRILVDGIDIRHIKQETLREKFAFVQQDIFLFPGTVLDNLRMMDDSISEERVWDALRMVSAENFVKALPNGINSELSERGLNLSQGERQLLSFARALVFDPQVFVLDEATSSIDPHTEVQIQKAVDAVLKGRTGIIIAHRLATVRKCDNILVMADGRVLESGSHSELLAAGGHYADMHCLQFSSPQPLALEEKQPQFEPSPLEEPYPESSRSTRRPKVKGGYDE
ncbi:MAG: ABC transporter ATP-binding protein [Planctomycetota bacterium]